MTGDGADRWRFRRGAVGADPIAGVVRDVVAELAVPGSEAARAAAEAGLDADRLAGARVEVAEGEQGLEPVLTTIVVSVVSSVGAKVVESFWNDLLWPRIKRRLGADALGRKLPDAATDEDEERDS